MTASRQLFSVHPRKTNIHVVVWGWTASAAKERARDYLSNGWGGPDNWDVIPITAPGDRVHLDITLSA